MHRIFLLVSFGFLLAGLRPVVAQGSQGAGWYIVQPNAEFVVLQLASTEVTGDSATDVAAYQQASIRAGEVVLLMESRGDTYLVFEWFGRLSAIRGMSALARAPVDGRPGYVIQDVQFLDRVLAAGSAVWITAINAGAGTATIVLDGGREEEIPAQSVSVLMNAYSDAVAQLGFQRVR